MSYWLLYNLHFSAVCKSDYDSTLVAERPLLTQVYNIIQQAGPRGFTLSVSFVVYFKGKYCESFSLQTQRLLISE